ncbi:unnamed protein product [Brassicogethes aeneus]|uniref:Uncharacterized protein n=1 Tax=Brassicogethes aeneus TaxID=1431903 RepID=A0A9P0B0L6_BRAAE|nr:unnamed protein product [Brassicogethes aeneus]
MKTVVGKVVVLGHLGVGKTSTITRYVENSFSHQVTPTIGASFFTCKITVQSIPIKMQIWDTAGQERFKALAPMFYRNANAAILVFDITNQQSFDSIKTWVDELKRNVEEAMVLCVVGNKIDLMHERKVSKEEGLKYSNSIGASYFECSAKDDQGVGVVFENIALGLLRMSVGKSNNTLKVYDDDINDIMAKSSELDATDVGNEEVVSISIKSIAHGDTVSSKCC